jgi:hypothetical protein
MQTDIEQRRQPYKFNVGDKVWLQAKQIKIHQQSSKLGPKQLGPFEVIEVRLDVDYKLALPPALKVHDVFHVDRLSPYKGNEVNGLTPHLLTRSQLKAKRSMKSTTFETLRSLVALSNTLFAGLAMGRVRILGSLLKTSCIHRIKSLSFTQRIRVRLAR